MENLPNDYFVTSHQFTRNTHRDVYPAIDPTAPANSLAGKVVVITGASQGLGAEGFAPSFAKANPKAIVLVARSEGGLQSVVKKVQAINKEIDVLAVPTDVTNVESVAQLWATIKEKFGHADILVNSAGTVYNAPVVDADPKRWWGDFEVNVHGAFLVSHGFLSLLGSRPGHIMGLTTGGALSVTPSLSSYAISKLASLQLNAYIAAEHPNVTAIAINPGVVLTNMTMDAFKRFALDSPALVGGTAVWLAGEKAAFLKGRYVSANWDVEDLVQRKEEIVKGDLLTMKFVGRLGKDQFE